MSTNADLTVSQVAEIAGGKSQTQAALNSFEVSSMDSAKSMGCELMKKPSIRDAVSDLLEYYGMGRVFRIKKLRTHADNRDPGVSLKSIDIANKMDRVYAEGQPEQTFMTKQELNVLNVSIGERNENLLRMEAELMWMDDKLSDKEFKDFLKELWGKKKDFELDDMRRWLLRKGGMDEREIEKRVAELNGGMTGMYETSEGLGSAG